MPTTTISNFAMNLGSFIIVIIVIGGGAGAAAAGSLAHEKLLKIWIQIWIQI